MEGEGGGGLEGLSGRGRRRRKGLTADAKWATTEKKTIDFRTGTVSRKGMANRLFASTCSQCDTYVTRASETHPYDRMRQQILLVSC